MHNKTYYVQSWLNLREVQVTATELAQMEIYEPEFYPSS